MARLNNLFQRLADKTNPWDDTSMGSSYRNRVQVKTTADLKAFGEELAVGGHVVYKVKGASKTLDEIGGMTDAQLDEVSVVVYPADVAPSDTEARWLVTITINNAGHSASVPGRFYMSVHRNYQVVQDNHRAELLTSRAKEVAEACTKGVRWWKRSYPVVKTISKATQEQRAHDKKVRWQSAWLSLLVSAPVGFGSAWLQAALAPAGQ